MPYPSPQVLATPSVPTIPSTSIAPTTQTETSTPSLPDATFVACLSLAIVLSGALLALGYKHYRAGKRSRLLKRQIAMLEAMWRISSTK